MNSTLAWILVLVSAASAGALAYVLLDRRRKLEQDLPAEWSLTPRPIFSAHERRVHRQLREALPQQVVLAKLPLIRFCQPADPSQVRYWFDLLGAIHVTFAVCNNHGRVLAAIDLEDGRNPARRSVQIKQAVLAACRIRYVRYEADHTPSVPELQLLVPPASAPVPTGAATVGHAGLRAAGTVGVEIVAARALSMAGVEAMQARESMFGRDSVISGLSHSGPRLLPERGGEVVEGDALRH